MRRAQVSSLARHDIDTIWSYVAQESRSVEIAGSVVDSITGRFPSLARSPEMGRTRDDLGVGVRSFRAGNYLIYYREKGSRVHVLRVIHVKRDQKAAFFERPQ